MYTAYYDSPNIISEQKISNPLPNSRNNPKIREPTPEKVKAPPDSVYTQSSASLICLAFTVDSVQLPKELEFVKFSRPYKAPPAAPDSKRTPEVIEAEMKALEAAMEALVLVTLKYVYIYIYTGFFVPFSCASYVDTALVLAHFH